MSGALPSFGLFDRLRHSAARIWAGRRLVLGVAASVGLLGALLVPHLPERYEARARVYVDTQSVLKPLMDGLAYRPDIDQQVRTLTRTVLTRPSLEGLLQRPELALPAATLDEREATLSRLMNRIKLAPTEAGLYVISYRDSDPHRALGVVEATLELFLHAGSGDQARDSMAAQRFISDQVSHYEGKLAEAESRLKEFKLRNSGVSGLSSQDYFLRIATLSDQLQRLTTELQAAERVRDSYRRELTGEEPPPRRGADPEGSLPPVTEFDATLAAERNRLGEMQLRFTDRHPDVVALKQHIEWMESRRNSELESRAGAHGSRAHDGRTLALASTSPTYQSLRVALIESEAKVASLRSRVDSEKRQLAEVRSEAARLPKVEAELAQLSRDYDVIRKNYEQMVARRESATLSAKLDESSRLRDFRVIEPPRLPVRPVFPGHAEMAVAVMLLSIGTGLSAPAVLNRLRPTFSDAHSLAQWTGRPVLGTLSSSLGATALRRRRHAALAYAAVALSLLVMQGFWLASMVASGGS